MRTKCEGHTHYCQQLIWDCVCNSDELPKAVVVYEHVMLS